MDSLTSVAIVMGIGAFVGWLIGYKDTAPRERQLTEREKKLDRIRAEVTESKNRTKVHKEEFAKLLEQAKEFECSLQHGMLDGRKWLADAFAEFVELRDLEVECWLAVKRRPAPKASEAVPEVRRKHREAVQTLKFLEYQLASYEEYFPILREYRETILDEVVDLRQSAVEALGAADPALSLGYLTKEEYQQLTTAEKYQRALDRYWNRRKSQVGIGRLYERYLGYLYETDGWDVRFEGALKGFADFGRDLICTRGSEVHIVQCKCWSKDKVMREKHIFQLFGTAVLFKLANPSANVTPVFATTTTLSEVAKAVAEELRVVVRTEPLKRFPMVKCNVNPGTNEKIYHLPFDQQYDRVIIGNAEGEFYAETVFEAESNGFRRAIRWRGSDE